MNKLTLNKPQQIKWIKNLLVFLAPVGILYLTTITGVISQSGHEFTVRDFIPNTFAQGGIILWFLNAALDYLRKLSG